MESAGIRNSLMTDILTKKVLSAARIVIESDVSFFKAVI